MSEERPTKPIPSLLFVCTANQIRSPMAVVLFKKTLQTCGQNSNEWRIESAGTWGLEGMPADPEALKVMKKRGLDLKQHRSRIVNRALMKKFRLILTMEKGHKEALQIEFPEIASRVFLLSEMAGQEKIVRDPIGGKPDDFEAVASEIEKWLSEGCQRIIELARK